MIIFRPMRQLRPITTVEEKYLQAYCTVFDFCLPQKLVCFRSRSMIIITYPHPLATTS